jgi:hypothetical protein
MTVTRTWFGSSPGAAAIRLSTIYSTGAKAHELDQNLVRNDGLYEVLHFAYVRGHRASCAYTCVSVPAIFFISSSHEPAEATGRSESFSSVGDNLHPIATYFRVLYDTAPLKSRWVQLKSSLAGGLLVGVGYIKRGVHCIPMAIAREEFRYLTS